MTPADLLRLVRFDPALLKPLILGDVVGVQVTGKAGESLTVDLIYNYSKVVVPTRFIFKDGRWFALTLEVSCD